MLTRRFSAKGEGRRPGLFRVSILLAALLGATLACGRAQEPAAPSKTAKEYQTRGLVKGKTADGREWRIQHEAIPEFIGIDGASAPMESMTMPFPMAPEVAGDLRDGDIVRFRFVVDWEASPPLVVKQVEKLPADTVLDFGPAPFPRPGADPPAAPADPAAKPDPHAGHGGH